MGMEKRGLERAVDWFQNNDLEIGTIVTDRHLQIQKWIRENLPATTHYYDVWHVAKGMFILNERKKDRWMDGCSSFIIIFDTLYTCLVI